jgi:hypothetical protein
MLITICVLMVLLVGAVSYIALQRNKIADLNIEKEQTTLANTSLSALAKRLGDEKRAIAKQLESLKVQQTRIETETFYQHANIPAAIPVSKPEAVRLDPITNTYKKIQYGPERI